MSRRGLPIAAIRLALIALVFLVLFPIVSAVVIGIPINTDLQTLTSVNP